MHPQTEKRDTKTNIYLKNTHLDDLVIKHHVLFPSFDKHSDN